jgi:hypothetical protein
MEIASGNLSLVDSFDEVNPFFSLQEMAYIWIRYDNDMIHEVPATEVTTPLEYRSMTRRYDTPREAYQKNEPS